MRIPTVHDKCENCVMYQRENRSLRIWLDQYEADATALIEEHGRNPSDKIDREILKRMLNCLIGKNRKLMNENEELKCRLN